MLWEFLKEKKDIVLGIVASLYLILLMMDVISAPKEMGINHPIFLFPISLFLIYLLALLIESVISLPEYRLQKMLKHLEEDIISVKYPMIIQIRNSHIPDIDTQISDAVLAKEIWDWTYLGSHPDCEGLCNKVHSEIRSNYLEETKFQKIKTSSVTLLKEYPFDTEIKIFLGEIICSPDRNIKTMFPLHPWIGERKKNYEIKFRNLYLVTSSYINKIGTCKVINVKKISNPLSIERYWIKTKSKLHDHMNDSFSLMWQNKNVRPKMEDREKFLELIDEILIKDCKKNKIVLVERDLHIRSILKELPNRQLWRLFLKALIIIGWILSPFTLWNDIFINIPISVYLASLFSGYLITVYTTLAGFFYILTNIVGFVFMFIGIKGLKYELRARVPKVKLILYSSAFIFLTVLATIYILNGAGKNI